MQTIFFRRGPLYICLLFLLAACARPTVPPTVTPTASPTHTHTPTPSPSPTSTPSPTAIPTSTPAPTMPGAAELLPRAEASFADGDYENALQIYQIVQETYAGTELAEKARLYTAQTYLAMGQMLSVTQVLSPALSPLPPSIMHQAQFVQAEAFRESGRYILALPLYQAYIQGGTHLEDLIAERMAWCYQALGLHGPAAEAFTNAASSYRTLSSQVWLLEEAARELRALGDAEQALARYESILAVSSNPWYRATILYQMGETLSEAGRAEEAHARWQEVLNTYPEENAASWAVDSLIAAGVDLDPYTVALAYRAAGRAGDALPWLEEAAAQGLAPARELGLALAWARSALGDLEGALSELGSLYQADPTDPQPLLEQGRLLGENGAISRALEVYGQVQAQHPDTSAAGEALWRSAALLEAQNHLQEAVSNYQSLLESYPNHERAVEARFRAGLLRYRQGRFSDAASLWAQGGDPDLPRSALWQGLALAGAGQGEEARAAWETAANGEGYYADRAGELLSTQVGFGQFHDSPVVEEEPGERIRAEHWLGEFWGQPVSATLPLEVQQNAHWLRGQELLSLGRPDEARQSFSQWIDTFRHDGPALYAMALYLRQIGLHGHAIRCADHLERLLPAEETEATPFILRLRYPTAYAHLVVQEAQAYHIDPLLLFAMIRRESYFDRYATSWADARGLTQVIPSTGEWIAGQLGLYPFRLEDLYRPIISIRFGAWYLGDQLRTFEGQALPALSAYNGGPGNALRWADHVAPAPDLDLFVEAVDFTETRGYIKGIYTDYWVYRRLYAGE